MNQDWRHQGRSKPSFQRRWIRIFASVRFSLTVLTICAALAADGPGPLYTLTTIAGTDKGKTIVDGIPAIHAAVGAETLAIDGAGNLYFGGGAGVYKISPAGIISTVVTLSPGTYQLGATLGVAVDATGAVYIADTNNNRVLRWSAGGTIDTIAGTGTFDSTGDGGPATAATLKQPFALVLDPQGNLYVGEYGGYRVRRIDKNGTISTFAGTGQFGHFGYNGDGIRATDAVVAPWGLALDDAGSLYISDGFYRVRKVTPDGIIHTVAGSGAGGYGGDGGPATAAKLWSSTGIAVDHAGNLYIADAQNQRVRVVTTDGIIRTVAGNGTPGSLLGPHRDAAQSQLYYPVGVLVDNAGNLYIADGQIEKVDAQGRLTAVMGSAWGAVGDGGSALAAQLAAPVGVALDAAGDIYLSDAAARLIRKIDANGIITTVAGDGEQGFDADDVPAIAAPLNGPRGIAIDSAGNLYIADADNHRVRRVGVDGVMHTVAGTGTQGFAGDGEAASAAQLSEPSGVALDSVGNLYIADTGNNRIRKVTPSGVITTIAGNGSAAYAGDGGPAVAASLSAPIGVAENASGNIYIADTGNHSVRMVSNTGMIATVAGTGVPGRSPDGLPARSAALQSPVSVNLDAQGNLFIADRDDGRIRRVRADDTMDTVAGSGGPGCYGCVDLSGGPGFILPLTDPQAIAVDPAGNLYFAETARVRKAAVAWSTGFSAPRILPAAVINAANLIPEPVSPGEVVTLFGTDLGPPNGAIARPDALGQIGTNLEGVQVLFDGVPAPVLYAQSYQVNAVVPFATAPKNNAQVQVEYSGRQSEPVPVSVAEAAPEVFLLDQPSPHGGRAAALNQDGSINSPDNPAAIGSVVTLYITGAGQMQPKVADGKIASDISPTPVLPVSAVFNFNFANPGTVLYAGPAPGIVEGVLQVNVRVQNVDCPVPNCWPDLSAIPVAIGVGARDPTNLNSLGKYSSTGFATIAVHR